MDGDEAGREPGTGPLAELGPAPQAQPAPAPSPEPRPSRRRLATLRRYVHLPRTRRGIAALLLVVGGLTGAGAVGAMQVIAWTETADFCGRCHTMGPELTAHAAGPHRDVACGECHVEPGVDGWIRAKINGTRQLVEIVLGTFPEPIPPPDHDNLPPPEDTCIRCHSLKRVGTTELVTRQQFTEDEANTRQFVGLLVRPGGGETTDPTRSAHWHVQTDVEYRALDENAQQIGWVRVVRPDGTVREFIAQNQVRDVGDVTPDVERLAEAADLRRMNCLDCHNRVGHPLPNPRRELDAALASGQIDPELPYIKREGMRVLWSSFASEAEADTAIEGLRDFYALRYPQTASSAAPSINAAIAKLKVLYRLSATPDMKVTARTYPDNLGHTDFVGCFRCHDGGHFLVKDGALTNETIPASCDTCHTFPQLGRVIASLPLGVPPASHDDRLWVFDHRTVATDLDPSQSSCGDCHARDYCSNCHSTGAVTVDHDTMLTNHAAVIRTSGAEACAYCHQPVYCARCHTGPVLPGGQQLGSTGLAPPTPGLRWPLVAAADAP